MGSDDVHDTKKLGEVVEAHVCRGGGRWWKRMSVEAHEHVCVGGGRGRRRGRSCVVVVGILIVGYNPHIHE